MQIFTALNVAESVTWYAHKIFTPFKSKRSDLSRVKISVEKSTYHWNSMSTEVFSLWMDQNKKRMRKKRKKKSCTFDCKRQSVFTTFCFSLSLDKLFSISFRHLDIAKWFHDFGLRRKSLCKRFISQNKPKNKSRRHLKHSFFSTAPQSINLWELASRVNYTWKLYDLQIKSFPPQTLLVCLYLLNTKLCDNFMFIARTAADDTFVYVRLFHRFLQPNYLFLI